MRTLFRLVAITLLLIPAGFASAADEPNWQAVTAELIEKEKPGYGKLCGVLVDPATGRLFVNLSDKGLYVSGDQGKTFTRTSMQPVKGRTEWPGCLMIDPTGKSKTLVMALVYGAPIAVSTDAGATWKMMDGKSGHTDWFAIDWTDAERRFVLALKHEAADLLLASHDGGKSFTEVGKGFGPAYIFDNQTAVTTQVKSKDNPKPGLLRTTDGAKSFQPTAAGFVAGKALPKWRDGKLYWLVDGALIATADQGATWKKVCDLKDGRYGPIFGKDAKQMFVLTPAGIVETTDGGVSWAKPLPLPREVKAGAALTWIDYDPRSDVLYTMQMTTQLYKLARGQ